MIKISNAVRKIIDLNPFCHLADKGDVIQLVEWDNGEGFDVVVTRQKSDDAIFSITYGEFEALSVLVKYPVKNYS